MELLATARAKDGDCMTVIDYFVLREMAASNAIDRDSDIHTCYAGHCEGSEETQQIAAQVEGDSSAADCA